MEATKYYALTVDDEARSASINIYGDITSWPWLNSDVSAYNLSKEIEGLDVDQIDVYINSYGGEVSEGLAIYNSLKRHKASIKTVCDGFACSISSVIFMAGDERVMNNASLLMIHNAWTYAAGNANDLRKEAEDLDKITSASVNAYMEYAAITQEELQKLLDNETWITPQEAMEYGFATSIVGNPTPKKAAQSVKKSLMKLILAATADDEEDEDTDDGTETADPEDPDDPETTDDPEEDEESEEDDETELESGDEDDETDDDLSMKMFTTFLSAFKK
nr:MAG TPA: Putative ATP dependent Clp protease [Caudoviricetes sp.]